MEIIKYSPDGRAQYWLQHTADIILLKNVIKHFTVVHPPMKHYVLQGSSLLPWDNILYKMLCEELLYLPSSVGKVILLKLLFSNDEPLAK
jgi:hypothetical protein